MVIELPYLFKKLINLVLIFPKAVGSQTVLSGGNRHGIGSRNRFLTSAASDFDDVIHRSSNKIPTLILKSTEPTKLKSDARGSMGKRLHFIIQ